MTRWEYKVVETKRGNPQLLLDLMGLSGWDLVTVIDNGGLMEVYFKRPLA